MGQAVWMEKCFCCDGSCKITTWDKKTKTANPSEDCPACEGRGYIMLQKSVTRKKA